MDFLDAQGAIEFYGKTDYKMAKEIVRIANDETIMARIKEGAIPSFSNSIMHVMGGLSTIFCPPQVEVLDFSDWFKEQFPSREFLKWNSLGHPRSRLIAMIEYDKKISEQHQDEALTLKQLRAYPAAPLPEGEKDISIRIKAVESDIQQIQERYKSVEERIEKKELSNKLGKLEQKRDIEQKRLEELEERLKKWDREDAYIKKGILK